MRLFAIASLFGSVVVALLHGGTAAGWVALVLIGVALVPELSLRRLRKKLRWHEGRVDGQSRIVPYPRGPRVRTPSPLDEGTWVIFSPDLTFVSGPETAYRGRTAVASTDALQIGTLDDIETSVAWRKGVTVVLLLLGSMYGTLDRLFVAGLF